MNRGLRVVSAAVLSVAVISGCGIRGTIVDFSNNETRLKKITLEPTEIFEIVHGGSTRRISVKEIARITILPREMRNINGNLYYMAEIVLDDGEEIGITDSTGNRVDAFVNIQKSISGETRSGPVMIQLDAVSQLILKETE